MDGDGEQKSRLDVLEADIKETKERLTSLETEFKSVKEGAVTMQAQLTGQDEKLDRILVWVDGANKVAGVAVRHWKTALKFGCGAVTAWGITNPHVASLLSFIGNFFGI